MTRPLPLHGLRVTQVAAPLRHPGPPAVRRAPDHGEHQRAVLSDLCGYTDEEIDGLAGPGAFGIADHAQPARSQDPR